MDYKDILFDIKDDIATITLNRPERMNAFTDTLLREWADALRQCQVDENVRVVVVTGAGRGFCAGADLKASGSEDRVLRMEANPGQRRNALRFSVQRVAQALQYMDKPYIAAINGAAAGAGMDMCSLADIRIASDQARFTMSYVNVGLVPGDGGAWTLPRIVGLQKALDLLWSADLFDARKALEIGYVLRVVPHESLMAETYAFARKLASGPPIAMQLTKRLVYRGLNTSLPEALEAAQAAMTIAQSTEDAREGPLAFREKRKPQFKGK